MKVGYTPWFLARLFLGVFLAYAGFTKLMEPIENFRAVIAQYEVIPYAWITSISLVLPWAEFLFGSFLVLGFAPRLSAWVLTVISFGFLLVLGSSPMLLEARPSDCGCFGQGALIHLSVRQIFVLDLANLALGLKLSSIKKHPWSLDHWLRV